MLALERRAGDTAAEIGWRCQSCHRYLATVNGDRFVRPNGDAGHLPAVIRCKCGQRNVLAAAGELDPRAYPA